jgi:hypothetical protein
MNRTAVPYIAVMALAVAVLAAAGCTVAKQGASAPAAKPAMGVGSAQKVTPMADTSAPATMSPDMKKPEATVSATAVSDGTVQRITVDLSSGSYVPNMIAAKAGVPIEITFGKGAGCVKKLVFPSFDIDADMTQGPRTFKLGALSAGEYKWQCGMDMKHGTIVVK